MELRAAALRAIAIFVPMTYNCQTRTRSYVIFTFSAARGLLRPEQGEHFHSSGLCLQIS